MPSVIVEQTRLRPKHLLSPTGWAVAAIAVLGLLVVAGPYRGGARVAQGHSTLAMKISDDDGIKSPIGRSATGAWVPTESTWGEQLRAQWGRQRGLNDGGDWLPARKSGLTRAEPRPMPYEGASVPLQSRDDARRTNAGDWRRAIDGSAEANDGDQSQGKTYRTMCVRLCDGFYFPINYAVGKDQFSTDEAACSRTCGGSAAARLFTYRNPGGEIEEMEDLEGRSYKKLQNAFLFRTKFNPSCKCRAQPWEDAAADRHKAYALIAQMKKGDKSAGVQLKELRVLLRREVQASAQGTVAQTPPAAPRKAAELAPPVLPKVTALRRTLKPQPDYVRGDQTTAGHFRALQSHAVAVSELPSAAETIAVVRLRFGRSAPRDVVVPRAQRAADAVIGRTLKQ